MGIEPPTDDIDNNGGHLAHDGVRPLVLGDHRNPGGAVIFRDDTDPAPLSVAGSTLSVIPLRGAPVLHRTPEVSGVLAIEAQLTAPPGQFFCSFTEAGRVQPYHFTVDVRVPGLERLPDVGTDYEVVRGGRDTHPEGTFATPQTMETLLKIAKKYKKLSGSKLSVNDLSLPAGGLFDIRNPWIEPHQTHREGVDADINLTNIAGTRIACTPDQKLHKAVEFVAAGAPRPFLHCEDEDNPARDFKHIDF